MKNIIRSLYDWTISWAKTKYATWALFAVAFIESSFFPIPPDVLLVAMVSAERKKWIWHATVCTLGSVLGALFGYLIGWAFYETLGKFIINTYHMQAVVELVGRKYQENAFLTVFTAAFSPIPYKAITITAGIFRISLFTLVIASIIGRTGRFFLVAGALRIFGKKIQDKIEKYFDLFSIVFLILLIGGFILLKYYSK
ncbi:MAG: DedA family protein [Candidatus Omnitrophica bacterium]|jgi:membrane protein YqaA with SNARE-associated domain|nr:DedA family protein [Candidatus Omnitrophota bacterium]